MGQLFLWIVTLLLLLSLLCVTLYCDQIWLSFTEEKKDKGGACPAATIYFRLISRALVFEAERRGDWQTDT